MTSSVCPVYQAECVNPRHRGKLVVLTSVCNTAAFCLANWMNHGLYFRGGALQWRFPLAFQLIFPIIVLPTFFFLPESPRWLLLKDRTDEAMESIRRYAGRHLESDDPTVIRECSSILATIQEERRDRVPAKDVLLMRDETQNLRRLLLSCGTMLMQQFTGVNALGRNRL
jgi:MFS family permease